MYDRQNITPMNKWYARTRCFNHLSLPIAEMRIATVITVPYNRVHCSNRTRNCNCNCLQEQSNCGDD